MSDLKRLRKLAGILAENEIIPPDEADEQRSREWDDAHAREKKITNLIAMAFVRAGLEPQYEFRRGKKDYTGVYFDLDAGEAHVTLDDMDVSLKRLAPLLSSGMAEDFIMTASSRGEMMVSFTLSPAILNGEASLV